MLLFSYVFGALCMAIAAGIRFAMDGNTKVFIIPEETYGGLAYAVLVSSALCYGLITFCNKHVSSLVVTASWPVQVLCPLFWCFVHILFSVPSPSSACLLVCDCVVVYLLALFFPSYLFLFVFLLGVCDSHFILFCLQH